MGAVKVAIALLLGLHVALAAAQSGYPEKAGLETVGSSSYAFADRIRNDIEHRAKLLGAK